jgi:hypothetical protein
MSARRILPPDGGAAAHLDALSEARQVLRG